MGGEFSAGLSSGASGKFRPSGESSTGLSGLAAFHAFRRGLAERWIEPPQSRDAAVVGNYGLTAQ
jgi:hypothetical protein